MASRQYAKETDITMNNEDNVTYNIAVKQEMDLNYDNINVKTENETHDETGQPASFNDIEVHVKEETGNQSDGSVESNTQESYTRNKKKRGRFDDLESMIKATKDCYDLSHLDKLENNDKITKTAAQELQDDGKTNIKHESTDDFTGCDYPSFDDGSMDSNEAAALCQVEACLQDDSSLKNDHYNFQEHQKEMYARLIKQESGLAVTETHLISNKLINTTSTITNPVDGVIESQTTKTLVMEILPMTDGNLHLSKIGVPEEILPTNNTHCNYDDTFQLNSITGNILSLEQEAYGLLKTKRKKNIDTRTPLNCPKCPKTYRNKYSLQRHLSVHESIEKREMGFVKGWKTRTQNRKKKLNEEIKVEVKEEKVKKEGYECTCGNVYRRRSRMETCLRTHNLFSDGDTCPCINSTKQFKSNEDPAVHRKRLHRRRFSCKFCPTDYNTGKELFKHLQAHQQVQLTEFKFVSEVVEGKQKLKCFICSRNYSELSNLLRHCLKDHKNPYTCKKCKKTFSKVVELVNHMKATHPDFEGQSLLDALEAFAKLVKAWKCEDCKVQFYEADKLALHEIQTHRPETKPESQFQCPDCRRVFISQKGLTSHRRIHHSTVNSEPTEPEEIGVMCVECRKICKDENALNSHMRFHSLERKYPCKFCDFRFATPEKRKAHAEIHTGDMKYVCFICEYQCSSENRLKMHKMSLKHLNMKEFLLTGKPLLEEEQPKIKSKKKKKEKWSEKKRKREEEKEENNSKVNLEVPCDICGDKFKSESEMLEHKQTHPFIEFPNEDTPSRIFFK
ncbi:hypothetical protein K1T71_013839 [Dendrolimus kikuchii]|uniref:Uncharacterized protein n=1 Tax=Dendrolimus kikuchii TaxID=765133 RepID=A0ACC1CFW3_9NEOP|nr:hypothetical protein K1T71_013839 [Dendrolimus kikuchii]